MGKKRKRGLIYRSRRERELIELARQMRRAFDQHTKHGECAKALFAAEFWLARATFAVNTAANGDDNLTSAVMSLHAAVRAIQDRMSEIALLELDGWTPYTAKGYPAEPTDPAPFVDAIADFLAAGGDFS